MIVSYCLEQVAAFQQEVECCFWTWLDHFCFESAISATAATTAASTTAASTTAASTTSITTSITTH